MNRKSQDRITSANHAAIEAANLKSVWSRESRLNLRTLIYCAELLERIAGQSAKRTRPRSAYQKFLSVEMKQGSTIAQAAAKWHDQKKAA